jgi:hypothetical protein
MILCKKASEIGEVETEIRNYLEHVPKVVVSTAWPTHIASGFVRCRATKRLGPIMEFS